MSWRGIGFSRDVQAPAESVAVGARNELPCYGWLGGSLVADGTSAYAGIVVHCTLALGCLHGMGSSRWACGAFLPDRGAY